MAIAQNLFGNENAIFCTFRYEITDEEHIAISHVAWSKFYSCAIQYHEAGLKPMGLICDGRTGLISIVKKSGHSFIRPGKITMHSDLYR